MFCSRWCFSLHPAFLPLPGCSFGAFLPVEQRDRGGRSPRRLTCECGKSAGLGLGGTCPGFVTFKQLDLGLVVHFSES